MTYTIENIASIIEGRPEGKSINPVVIKDLLFDSRLLISPENTLFFSLKSNRNNGSKYIDELYNKGVRCFAIDDATFQQTITSQFPLSTFIVVDDTLKALQRLAAHHRGNFNIPIVGITGSNGKTIIKEWLYGKSL